MALLGKDVYVVADPDLLGTALLDRETFAKPDDFEAAFGEALLAVEGDQWRRQRHATEPFFTPTRIGEYAETMAMVTADRIDRWSPDERVRIDDEMRTIALANLFEVILGESLSDDGLADLTDAAYALNRRFEPTTWALPDWVPTPARRDFRRGSKRLRDRARTVLDETDADPDDSLLASLAALQNDPDSDFDREEVLDQVVGMLFAGHETTALAMTYALHLIGSHPAVADRCYAEVDAVLDGRPSLADLQDLSYLEQVIHETLRLYPPVHGVPRVTTDPATLGEYDLPEDALVQLAILNVHRDPRFYDHPLDFDPERWADTTPRDRGHEFVPFGAGPRICIGRHFARLEMKAVLATICRRFRIETEGRVEIAPQMTSQPDGPVLAGIAPRGSKE
jgi:cytochrome P450